jgi:hypothetical protein
VSIAEPVDVGLACETAVMVTVALPFAGISEPETKFGAVKTPDDDIAPVVALPPVTPFTCQFTAVFDVPVTVAVNVTFPNVITDELEPATLTVTLLPPPPVVVFDPLQPIIPAAIEMKKRDMSGRRIIPPASRRQPER